MAQKTISVLDVDTVLERGKGLEYIVGVVGAGWFKLYQGQDVDEAVKVYNRSTRKSLAKLYNRIPHSLKQVELIIKTPDKKVDSHSPDYEIPTDEDIIGIQFGEPFVKDLSDETQS